MRNLMVKNSHKSRQTKGPDSRQVKQVAACGNSIRDRRGVAIAPRRSSRDKANARRLQRNLELGDLRHGRRKLLPGRLLRNG